ncbi:MAG: glycoside hydrolase family 140 protein [Candidatus Brocadiia bacterium]
MAMSFVRLSKPLFPSPGSVKSLRFKVSPNGRYLMTAEGRPFYYLADTAWTLFKRLNHEEADVYFENRVARGFTAIQAYCLRGLHAANLYGDYPLLDRDPTRPNEAFFRNIDYLVNRANELGLVMGIVTCVGEHVRKRGYDEQIFTESNAFAFGKFLGSRYKDNAVIWYLGGDRSPMDDFPVWTAMARGLKEGSAGRQLVSYHGHGPSPGFQGYSSSFWLHNMDWLDFNTIQSSWQWGTLCYEFVTHDYLMQPPKPTIDMEFRYENHIPSANSKQPRINAHQIREAGYWNMLAGAAGLGYGAQDIWQFFEAGNPRLSYADYSLFMKEQTATYNWRDAINYEGSYCMGLLRRLLEMRPWHQLVPDQGLIHFGQGILEDHIQSARAADGAFALAYTPFGHPFTVQMDRIAGARVKAHWYDPRTGRWKFIAEYPNTGTQVFVPPYTGDQMDWALVLDDDARNLPVADPE